MNEQQYEKWAKMTKKIQESFQAIVELNIKTLQNLSYLKIEELAEIKKPDEFLEKQLNLAIENGHKGLDYMQKSFQIIEKAMIDMVTETKKANRSIV